jgi:hypothetical protein
MNRQQAGAERQLFGDQPSRRMTVPTSERCWTNRVSPSTFSRALRRFGSKQLVEIVDLMGEYAAVAVLLDAFDQQLPEGQTALLPLR